MQALENIKQALQGKIRGTMPVRDNNGRVVGTKRAHAEVDPNDVIALVDSLGSVASAKAKELRDGCSGALHTDTVTCQVDCLYHLVELAEKPPVAEPAPTH